MSRGSMVAVISLVLSLCCAPCRSQQTDAVVIPEAVRDFMAFNTESLQRQAAMWASRDRSVTPGVCLTYFFAIPMHDADGKPQVRWLIGYRLGRMAHTYMNRAVVTDENGRKLSDLPEQFAGDRCVVFELNPGVWAAAMTYGGRSESESIYVWSLDHPQRPLLQYYSRKNEDWESTLYFVSPSQTNDAAILVDRTILPNHAENIRNEHEVFRFNRQSGSFNKGVPLTSAEFLRDLASAKMHKSLNRLHQYPPPSEIRGDH